MTGNRKDPLLPRPVLVFIAVVVTLGWLGVVISVILNPANNGPLVVVSGLLTAVIGASFGISVGRPRNDSKNGNSGDGSS